MKRYGKLVFHSWSIVRIDSGSRSICTSYGRHQIAACWPQTEFGSFLTVSVLVAQQNELLVLHLSQVRYSRRSSISYLHALAADSFYWRTLLRRGVGGFQLSRLRAASTDLGLEQILGHSATHEGSSRSHVAAISENGLANNSLFRRVLPWL